MQVSFQTELLEAGCDEAGRGCLAGPVFAAAVILPAGFAHPLLNDSKQMPERDRELLRPIIEREAVAWSVASVAEERIDAVNILNASIEAMNAAVAGLAVKPGFLAIDGNRFRSLHGIGFRCIVKGDSLYANIAAASVLAKTHRDEYMGRIAEEFPYYNWKNNKGYPTRAHTEAIRIYGLSPYHRRTFGPCGNQLSLF